MGVRFNNSTVIALTVAGLAGIISVIPVAADSAREEQADTETTVTETTTLFDISISSTVPPTTAAVEVGIPPYDRDMAIHAWNVAANATPTTSTTVAAPVEAQVQTELKCPEWQATAVEAGWPADQLAMVDKIIYRESRCHTDSFNRDDPNGGSRGLMQINGIWCDWFLPDRGIIAVCDDLFNPLANLRAGLAIWQRSGWGPWGF